MKESGDEPAGMPYARAFGYLERAVKDHLKGNSTRAELQEALLGAEAMLDA